MLNDKNWSLYLQNLVRLLCIALTKRNITQLSTETEFSL